MRNKERKEQLFETQSKEQVSSSDQLFKSIYSSFLVDVVVIIIIHHRHIDIVKRRKKTEEEEEKGEQGRDKKM
jgi:hypothetical protein